MSQQASRRCKQWLSWDCQTTETETVLMGVARWDAKLRRAVVIGASTGGNSVRMWKLGAQIPERLKAQAALSWPPLQPQGIIIFEGRGQRRSHNRNGRRNGRQIRKKCRLQRCLLGPSGRQQPTPFQSFAARLQVPESGHSLSQDIGFAP